jgi:hypothetical protein
MANNRRRYTTSVDVVCMSYWPHLFLYGRSSSSATTVSSSDSSVRKRWARERFKSSVVLMLSYSMRLYSVDLAYCSELDLSHLISYLNVGPKSFQCCRSAVHNNGNSDTCACNLSSVLEFCMRSGTFRDLAFLNVHFIDLTSSVRFRCTY